LDGLGVREGVERVGRGDGRVLSCPRDRLPHLVDRWVGRVREAEATVRDHPDAHAARLGERESFDLAAMRLHGRRRALLAERLDVLAPLGRLHRGGAQVQQVRHRCRRP
jgi:hypothetical protein